MPGTVGLITRMPREDAERKLLQMVEALLHEAFYVAGTYVDAGLGLYVGWVARRGSFSDGMPLYNETNDVTIVFSGEDFSDSGDVHRLRSCGHVFGNGAQYLPHMYEEDSHFPRNLNGRFHGLVADRKCQVAVLFNDRYGMHRIYYHESADAFYFAAESKAILNACPRLKEIDVRSLGELVACGCVLENRTLFKDIRVLPAGSRWVFRNGTIEKRAEYFKPCEWENQPILEPEPYYRGLRDTFGSVLPRYFNGGELIGMSLTGGLDTRMIMAWQKSPPGSLPCYSFGGMFRESQDVVLARRIAKECGQTHQVIPVAEKFLSAFPKYAERTVYLTDGCADVSHSADLYVNEHAARIAPVRMTGNYGGEVLRRVVAFKPVKLASNLFAQDLQQQVTAAESTYASLRGGHPLSFALFRQAPWHHYGLLALEQTQLSLRSPFLDNELVRMVFRAPQSACTNNDISRRIIADGNTLLTKIPTDRGSVAVADGWRAQAVRSWIAVTVKAEYGYDYGMPQWVACVDHICSGLHFERLFLGRHKFYHYRTWYKNVLSSYVRDMLLDRRTLSRPYLQRRAVEQIVNGHITGLRNYTSELHKVLTLELVHRLFFD